MDGWMDEGVWDEGECFASAYSAYMYSMMHSVGPAGGPCIPSAISVGLAGRSVAIILGLLLLCLRSKNARSLKGGRRMSCNRVMGGHPMA